MLTNLNIPEWARDVMTFFINHPKVKLPISKKEIIDIINNSNIRVFEDNSSCMIQFLKEDEPILIFDENPVLSIKINENIPVCMLMHFNDKRLCEFECYSEDYSTINNVNWQRVEFDRR
jgi:hypothetical protein